MSKRGGLRTLPEQAWNRELGVELARVESAIADWRRGQGTALEVSDVIHDFEKGAGRRLHGLYTTLEPRELVARAVAWGVLERNEVPADLLAELESMIHGFERLAE